ncbi:Mu transposase C-terminal domain-containing protein [Rhodoferax sp.]|uniref:Mu transposase C-terminal domain-containing protein n=1 Tax=Rhodoferax sp. TaxID=50421 RepID=UPI0028415B2C|nr:Mu transposase C-terminal domain-containing protein [Rhodoferax sp.]MDR3370697.1 Mu transposase C-terminal domain-containing protein [Rhodoferax sp.]
MGALLKLTKDIRQMSEISAALNPDPWANASEEARRVAGLRESLIAPLVDLVNGGASINHAAALLKSQLDAGTSDLRTKHLVAMLAGDATVDVLSVPTLKRWLSGFIKGGKNSLLPKHTGRVRQAYGWEERAVDLYNLPGKPGYADVSSRLIQEGFKDATESRVKRYLKALPATLGKFSADRIGKHLHKLTRQKFQRRSLAEVLVGEIYAGDGHTADCYVAHPNTGKPFRPELTVFIDIKSSFISGWWMSESESTVSTMFALSHAMRMFNHVPAWVYVDRGPGYRARLLSDESTGFYSRFDIGLIGALPGNPHGKGWIERFFRTVRDKHDKFFAGGQVYCGDDMAPETNRRLSADLAMGRRQLPSLKSYVDSFTAWLEHYHDQPQDKLNGRTPAQVWAELTPVPVELSMDAIARPREECTVGRQTVRLHNRFYYAEALALFDAQKVDVEYDLHHDSHVWVFDKKGRFIVEAKLNNTIGVLPTSRLEEGRDRRLAGQLKRLQRKVDEATRRRDDPVDATSQAAAIESLAPAAPALPAPTTRDDDFKIDLLTWRNDQ